MVKKVGIDVRLWSETGIGRYTRNLVENLGKSDSNLQYILFGLPKDLDGINHQVAGFKNKSNFVTIGADIRWHSVAEQIRFPKLLNTYNLDLMHFPYFSVPVFYNKPFIVTVHDLIINHFSTGQATTLPLPMYYAKRFGYSFILKNAITKSVKIITPSMSTKQEVLEHYNVSESKIIVTPEGVDSSILDFKLTTFREKHPYFLYVGNAYPHKNIEKLIDAFILFSEKYPEYKLRLVGKKDYFYKKLINRTKHKNIEFAGYLSDHDLSKQYMQSDALFVPSLMEGFGLTALEGMKMGAIVACSDIPSLNEVCGKNAFYFEPSDVLSIIAIMEQIKGLSKDARLDMIKQGKKQVEKFSWEKMTKETIDVYNSCL